MKSNIQTPSDERIKAERIERFNYLKARYLKLWGPAGTEEEAIMLAAEFSGVEVIETETEYIVMAIA